MAYISRDRFGPEGRTDFPLSQFRISARKSESKWRSVAGRSLDEHGWAPKRVFQGSRAQRRIEVWVNESSISRASYQQSPFFLSVVSVFMLWGFSPGLQEVLRRVLDFVALSGPSGCTISEVYEFVGADELCAAWKASSVSTWQGLVLQGLVFMPDDAVRVLGQNDKVLKKNARTLAQLQNPARRETIKFFASEQMCLRALGLKSSDTLTSPAAVSLLGFIGRSRDTGEIMKTIKEHLKKRGFTQSASYLMDIMGELDLVEKNMEKANSVSSNRFRLKRFAAESDAKASAREKATLKSMRQMSDFIMVAESIFRNIQAKLKMEEMVWQDLYFLTSTKLKEAQKDCPRESQARKEIEKRKSDGIGCLEIFPSRIPGLEGSRSAAVEGDFALKTSVKMKDGHRVRFFQRPKKGEEESPEIVEALKVARRLGQHAIGPVTGKSVAEQVFDLVLAAGEEGVSLPTLSRLVQWPYRPFTKLINSMTANGKGGGNGRGIKKSKSSKSEIASELRKERSLAPQSALLGDMPEPPLMKAAAAAPASSSSSSSAPSQTRKPPEPDARTQEKMKQEERDTKKDKETRFSIMEQGSRNDEKYNPTKGVMAKTKALLAFRNSQAYKDLQERVKRLNEAPLHEFRQQTCVFHRVEFSRSMSRREVRKRIIMLDLEKRGVVKSRKVLSDISFVEAELEFSGEIDIGSLHRLVDTQLKTEGIKTLRREDKRKGRDTKPVWLLCDSGRKVSKKDLDEAMAETSTNPSVAKVLDEGTPLFRIVSEEHVEELAEAMKKNETALVAHERLRRKSAEDEPIEELTRRKRKSTDILELTKSDVEMHRIANDEKVTRKKRMREVRTDRKKSKRVQIENIDEFGDDDEYDDDDVDEEFKPNVDSEQDEDDDMEEHVENVRDDSSAGLDFAGDDESDDDSALQVEEGEQDGESPRSMIFKDLMKIPRNWDDENEAYRGFGHLLDRLYRPHLMHRVFLLHHRLLHHVKKTSQIEQGDKGEKFVVKDAIMSMPMGVFMQIFKKSSGHPFPSWTGKTLSAVAEAVRNGKTAHELEEEVQKQIYDIEQDEDIYTTLKELNLVDFDAIDETRCAPELMEVCFTIPDAGTIASMESFLDFWAEFARRAHTFPEDNDAKALMWKDKRRWSTLLLALGTADTGSGKRLEFSKRKEKSGIKNQKRKRSVEKSPSSTATPRRKQPKRSLRLDSSLDDSQLSSAMKLYFKWYNLIASASAALTSEPYSQEEKVRRTKKAIETHISENGKKIAPVDPVENLRHRSSRNVWDRGTWVLRNGAIALLVNILRMSKPMSASEIAFWDEEFFSQIPEEMAKPVSEELHKVGVLQYLKRTDQTWASYLSCSLSGALKKEFRSKVLKREGLEEFLKPALSFSRREKDGLFSDVGKKVSANRLEVEADLDSKQLMKILPSLSSSQHGLRIEVTDGETSASLGTRQRPRGGNRPSSLPISQLSQQEVQIKVLLEETPARKSQMGIDNVGTSAQEQKGEVEEAIRSKELKSIRKKQSKGKREDEVMKVLPEKEIQKLVEGKSLFRVPCYDHYRLVDFEHSKPWLAPTKSQDASDMLVMEKWTSVDGKYDLELKRTMEQAVLHEVLEHPGCTLEDLHRAFFPFLDPIDVKTLLQPRFGKHVLAEEFEGLTVYKPNLKNLDENYFR